MRDVIAIIWAEHEKFVLMGGTSMQPVSAIEHEYLERQDAVVEDEMFHFVDMPGLDRRNVIAVIDPESSLGLLEHFRHEVAVWTAAIEIVMARAYVVQARGHAAHRRRLALRNRVLGERRINTDVHMGVDAAREGEKIPGVENLFRLFRLDVRRQTRDLSFLDGDVEAIDRGPVGTHHAGVLDDEIIEFFHSRLPASAFSGSHEMHWT